ncbi:tRNA (N(6)-L-threonylcarbamoyladenosine(37)-C(2))-methylthiotransferase [Candidatus Bathyarchaeota archaeon]|nr:tRNA (N(6)-L-threonylcarbamoyladenosine(37)-C(2))-methylthiotransferase [Candidatus Bathyarchaeota archaeon]
MDRERTFYLESYGCTLNAGDSLLIRAILEGLGFKEVNKPQSSLVTIVNTCGVKTPTEQKILHRLSVLGQLDTPAIIITGCLPEILSQELDRIVNAVPDFAAMIGPRNYHELKSVISQVLEGKRHLVHLDHPLLDPKMQLPSATLSGHVAILPIAEGCLGSCTYCCTRIARGAMQSYPASFIKSRFNQWRQEGIRMFYLTAEDCSAYLDREKGIRLPELVDSLACAPGLFFLRIGMMNPASLLPVKDRLLESYRSPRIFDFLHVPVQSGSNDVLEDMGRKYQVKDFRREIEDFRNQNPRITISTDIICGFPTETDRDFESTIKLMEDIQPDNINISMYGHRPGTIASSSLDALPSSIVKRRSRQLTTVFTRIRKKKMNGWIGWEGLAIINKYHESKLNHVARNQSYMPIVLKNGHGGKIGDLITVRITSTVSNSLLGEVIGFVKRMT